MIDKLVKAISLKETRIVAVAMTTGFLLFLPMRALDAVGLSSLAMKYQSWIGGVFLLSVAILLAEGSAVPARYFKVRFESWLQVRDLAKVLRSLTGAEREVLAQYLLNDTKSMNFSAMDGVIAGLEGQGVLKRLTNIGYGASAAFQYGLQPWAWQYLKQYPELVGVAARETNGDR